MPSGGQDNGYATGDCEGSGRTTPSREDVASANAFRDREAARHPGVMRPERGIIGLVAKASALVDQAKELLDRLEQEGEIVIEMQTTLRIQVPRRAMRGDDDAS